MTSIGLDVDGIKLRIDDVFNTTPALFIAEKSKDMDGVYQVIFTDVDYPWYTVIESLKCTTHQGLHSSPVVTMKVRSTDFVNIVSGRLNETLALMTGKVKLEGNLVLAVKYSGLFEKYS